MGLRRWVRARRITTPPEVVPLVVLGVFATWVAWAVFEALFGILAVVEVVFFDTEDVSALASGAGAVVSIILAVAGSYLLRRLVAGWVRRQPPDPPRALDR